MAVMTTFGLALDSDGNIWQYQGANGMIKLGTFVPEEPEDPEPTAQQRQPRQAKEK